jgi:hypothetical protein
METSIPDRRRQEGDWPIVRGPSYARPPLARGQFQVECIGVLLWKLSLSSRERANLISAQ